MSTNDKRISEWMNHHDTICETIKTLTRFAENAHGYFDPDEITEKDIETMEDIAGYLQIAADIASRIMD